MGQRVLICGDRYWTNKALIHEKLREIIAAHPVDLVIEGEAPGADILGKQVAKDLGIKVKPFHANWGKYGKAAGPIRNREMLVRGRPTLVLAFHNDIAKSKGTKDMKAQAEKYGVPVVVVSE